MQLVAVHAQHRVKAVAVVFGLDFLCIRGRNGRDRGGSDDSRLHQVDVAVHGHEARAEVRVVDAEDVLQDFAAVAALILDIVDGEHGLDVFIERTGREHQIVVDRDQSGLPVVAVDDVRLPVEVGQHFEHCLGVVREALCVVVLAVDLTAREVILVVDEVEGHAVRLIAENAAVLVAPAQTDVCVLDIVELFPHFLADRGVQRAEYADIVALCRERLGQRACHVAQTAGLDERSAFAGYVHDFHKCRASPQAEVWEPAGFLSSLVVRQGSRIPPDALLISLLYSFPASCNIGIFHEHFSCRSRFFRPSPVHFTENTQIVEFFAMVMG